MLEIGKNLRAFLDWEYHHYKFGGKKGPNKITVKEKLSYMGHWGDCKTGGAKQLPVIEILTHT